MADDKPQPIADAELIIGSSMLCMSLLHSLAQQSRETYDYIMSYLDDDDLLIMNNIMSVGAGDLIDALNRYSHVSGLTRRATERLKEMGCPEDNIEILVGG